MSNMNSRMRNTAYPYLKNMFGPYCRGCQALESERELVIDHIDNNNKNNNNKSVNNNNRNLLTNMLYEDKITNLNLLTKITKIC